MKSVGSLHSLPVSARLTFAFTILIFLLTYVTYHASFSFESKPSFARFYRRASIFYFILSAVSLFSSKILPFRVAQLLLLLTNPFILFLANLFVSVFLLDLIRFANYIFHFSSDNLRHFRLLWMSITLLIILILYIFGFLNVRSIQIVNLEITSDLPPQNRELHIVLVSDTHFGYLITKSKFQNWVKLINSQNPDIIIFAGDISDHFIEPVIHQNLHEEFNELISKYGIFAVTGNHEFMSSPRDGLEQYLKKKTHVKYLRDSSELIDNSFYVIGRDDRSNRQRLTLRALAKDFNRTKPVIVIDHQPMDLQESVENGITVTLCGHTHAGQFFPATVAVKFVFDLSYGYGKRGNSHFYVSSGLGVWGPQCRIGSKSEIVKIKLSY